MKRSDIFIRAEDPGAESARSSRSISRHLFRLKQRLLGAERASHRSESVRLRGICAGAASVHVCARRTLVGSSSGNRSEHRDLWLVFLPGTP